MKGAEEVQIDPRYWYQEDDIKDLLQKILQDTANVIAQTQFEHDSLLTSNLRMAIAEAILTNKPSVIPMHLHGNHWSAMVIIKTGEELKVIYQDPKGSSIETESNIVRAIGAIQAVAPAATIIDLRLRQQTNYNDCGPITVDNVARLVRNDIADKPPEEIKSLLMPLGVSSEALREHHARLRPQLRIEHTNEESAKADEGPAQVYSTNKSEDARSKKGHLAMLAVRSNTLEVLELLLDGSSCDGSCDMRGLLSEAAEKGYSDIVDFLLKKFYFEEGENYSEPLILAAKNGHIKVVKSLLHKGHININGRDKEGNTPLSMAVKNGYVELTMFLLKNGASFIEANDRYRANSIAKNPYTDLFLEVMNGHIDAIRPILSGKPFSRKFAKYEDAARKYSVVGEALCLAAIRGEETLVGILLGYYKIYRRAECIGHSYTENIKGEVIFKSLYLAVQSGHSKVVQLLLKEETFCNKFDTFTEEMHIQNARYKLFTLLCLASEKGYAEIAAILLENGTPCECTKVSYSDDYGYESHEEKDWPYPSNSEPPLYLAVQHKHIELVNLLLKHYWFKSFQEVTEQKKGQINLYSNECIFKSLSLASENGYTGIAESLVQYISSLGQSWPAGSSEYDKWQQHKAQHLFEALCVASNGGYIEIVLLLLENGAPHERSDEDNNELQSGNIRFAYRHFDSPLLSAARNGHAPVVEILLKRGCSCMVRGHFSDTPLLAAVKHKHAEVIALLEQAYAEEIKKMYFEGDGDIALYSAIENGQTTIVSWLIDRTNPSININKRIEGQTFLTKAAELGHSEIVEFLVSKGIMVDATNDQSDTALHISAMKGHHKIVEKLCSLKPHSIDAINKNGMTPLMCALEAGHALSAECLLKAGAIIGHIIDDGTELHIAIKNKDNYRKTNFLGRRGFTELVLQDDEVDGDDVDTTKIVAILIDAYKARDISIDIADGTGATPLICALKSGCTSSVELLLGAGAVVRGQIDEVLEKSSSYDFVGFSSRASKEKVIKRTTELHIAIDKGVPIAALIKAYQSRDISVDVVDETGTTPLLHALKAGRVSDVECLLEAGASLGNAVKGNTDLHTAIDNYHAEAKAAIVKALIKAYKASGLSIDIVNEAGDTPLMYALKKGCSHSVELLLEAGATLSKGAKNPTELHLAINSDYRRYSYTDGRPDMVSVLIKAYKARGISIDAVDVNGDTPLICALKKPCIHSLELLLDAGALVGQKVEDGTELHFAIKRDYSKYYGAKDIRTDLVSALIKAYKSRDTSIDTVDEKGATPLICALKQGYAHSANKLLEAGAAVGQIVDGYTELHLASGYPDIMASLIKIYKARDLSIDIVNKAGETPLMCAIKRYGCARSVDLLLEAGAAVGQVIDGSTELHLAIGHPDTLASLIKLYKIRGIAIDTADKTGVTPLICALSRGYAKSVEILLDAGATVVGQVIEPICDDLSFSRGVASSSVTSKKVGHTTELHLAIKSKCDRSAVAALIKKYQSSCLAIDIVDSAGLTPLMYALKNGHLDSVETLLEEGAAIGQIIDASIDLHFALNKKTKDYYSYDSDYGYVSETYDGEDIANALIKAYKVRGMPVDIKDATGTTPLVYALQRGFVSSVVLLLDAGAAVGQIVDGEIDLHFAINHDYRDILKPLIEAYRNKGISVDIIDKNGDTPLVHALKKGCASGVEFLLDAGASLGQREGRFTELHIAINSDGSCHSVDNGARPDTLDALISAYKSRGLSIDGKNEMGHTPIMLALKRSCVVCVELLLEAGAAVGQIIDGTTDLHFSVNLNKGDIVAALIKAYKSRNISIDVANETGDTPLMWAVQRGYVAIMEMLLEAGKSRGISVNIKNKTGDTPLISALKATRSASKVDPLSIIKPLLNAGAAVGQTIDGTTDLHLAVNKEIKGDYRGGFITMDGNGKCTSSVVGTLVEFYKARGLSVDIKDETGVTPLMGALKAVRSAHKVELLSVIEILLEAGAAVGQIIDETTDLHFTINELQKPDLSCHSTISTNRKRILAGRYCEPSSDKYKQVIAALIKAYVAKGLSVEVADKTGATPLICALKANCIDGVKLLLGAGASVGQIVDGDIDLHFAINHDRPNIMSALAEAYEAQGHSIDVKNKDGQTVFMHSMIQWKGATEKYLYLIDMGIDPNIPDNEGVTPIIYAIKNGWHSVVKDLVTEEVRFDLTDSHGQDAIDHALSLTPDLHREDILKIFAFREAAMGHAPVLKKILLTGFDPNSTNELGQTLLYVACYNRHVNIVDLLLGFRANPNLGWLVVTQPTSIWGSLGQPIFSECVSEDGAGLFAPALKRGKIEEYPKTYSEQITPTMVIAGYCGNAIKNTADKYGCSGVFLSDYTNREEGLEIRATILKSLIQHGADLTLLDAQGRNAYSIARHYMIGAVFKQVVESCIESQIMPREIADKIIGQYIDIKKEEGEKFEPLISGILYEAGLVSHPMPPSLLYDVLNEDGNPSLEQLIEYNWPFYLNHPEYTAKNIKAILQGNIGSSFVQKLIMGPVRHGLSLKSQLMKLADLVVHTTAKYKIEEIFSTYNPAKISSTTGIGAVASTEAPLDSASLGSLSTSSSFSSSSSSASSSSCSSQSWPSSGAFSSPSAYLSDTDLKGKGDGYSIDGVSPGEMVAALAAEGLRCPIEFSNYATLPETVLHLADKALIDVVGGRSAHWVVGVRTAVGTPLVIWPGEVPSAIFVSASEVGIVVVSVPQAPGKCGAAALYVLGIMEADTTSIQQEPNLIEYSNADYEEAKLSASRTFHEAVGWTNYFQSGLSKATFGCAYANCVINLARTFEEPTFANIKENSVSLLRLYSMYSGFNIFSVGASLISAVDAWCEGGLLSGLYSLSTSVAYMALPTILLASAAPWVGLTYLTAIATFTSYHLAVNTYSYFSTLQDKERTLKSYSAWRYDTKLLADKTGLKIFESKAKEYSLKINDLQSDIEAKNLYDKVVGGKGEFGSKLYQYIYFPLIKEKHDLQAQVIEGLLPKEEAEAQEKAQTVSIKTDTIKYDLCRVDAKTEAGSSYYCADSANRTMYKVEIVGEVLKAEVI